MRDIEEEEGGAGVFNINLRDNYLLENDEWKNDRIPEYFEGKNVYDFIDPEIDSKLAALEEEESRLAEEGYYDEEEELEDADEVDIKYKADLIREKRMLIRNANKMRKSLKNKAIIPRNKKNVDLNTMTEGLEDAGYDTSKIEERARNARSNKAPSRSRAATEDSSAMDVDATAEERLRSKSRVATRTQTSNRNEMGITDGKSKEKAAKLAKLVQRQRNRMARQGDADHRETASKAKWLLAGKRGNGTHRSR